MPDTRLRLVIGFFTLVGVALFLRFFYLQVENYEKYATMAENLHWGGIRLPAQRGEIVIQDNLTKEVVPLAANANLDLLYFDPKFMMMTYQGEQIGDPETVVQELAPILYPVFVERKKESLEKKELAAEADLPGNRYFIKKNNEVVEMTGIDGVPISEIEARCIDQCINRLTADKLTFVASELRGIKKDEENSTETGSTPAAETEIEISPEEQEQCESQCKYHDQETPKFINDELGVDAPVSAEADSGNPDAESMLAFRDWLREQIYQNKEKRYVPIIRRLPPEVSIQIDELEQKEGVNMKGVARIPESWRYYPEGILAAALIGFTDHDRIGRYGVEEQWDIYLKGKDGRILTEKDTSGREIAVGEKIVERAQDGVKIELTIDRAVQSKIEEILQRRVKEFSADSAQAIVMEPETGKVIAMAQYPSFDPNNFWDVYQKRYLTDPELQKISGEWQENHRYYPIMREGENNGQDVQSGKEGEDKNNKEDLNPSEDKQISDLDSDSENEANTNPSLTEKTFDLHKRYYVYQNAFGPAVYRNKNVDEVWEPGSIFKSLVMAAALDAHALTPDTRCDICDAPVKLNEYYVHTWNDKYRPNQTMSQTLQWSDNTGMVFVAQKLGKKMLWQYLKNFGFGERTGLGFDSEQRGVVPLWRYLADIDHATLAFGQGISVTSIQMITAFSSLINGGYLMKPYLIDQITYPDGQIKEIEPEIRRRVISDEASAVISSMLVSVIEKGGGKFAGVEGYYAGGKTGTAQISGFYTDEEGVRRYGYEEGIGTTIASFIGFAPLGNPQFTLLVKFDRPRTNEWGSRVAAPTWSEIAEFLLKDYYRVPPGR